MLETVYGVYNRLLNEFVEESEIYPTEKAAYDFLKYAVEIPEQYLVIPLTYTKPKQKVQKWGIYDVRDERIITYKFETEQEADKKLRQFMDPTHYQVFSFTVEV